MDNTRETNPLRMLRSGVPVLKPKVRGKKQPNFGNLTSQIDDISGLSDSTLSFDQHQIQFLSTMQGLPTFNQSMCLSTAHSLDRHNSLLGIENDPNHNNVDENPIPLPPRDRSKTLQPKSNLPRHQRKHPLIIPGNGVSRTLAKMAVGDQVDGSFSSFHESDSKAVTVKNTLAAYTSDSSPNSPEEFEKRIDMELAALDSLPIDNNRHTSDLLDFSDSPAESDIKENEFMLFNCDIEDPKNSKNSKTLQENDLKLNCSTVGIRSEYSMHNPTVLETTKKSSNMNLHKLDQSNIQICDLETLSQTLGAMHSNNKNFPSDKCSQVAKQLSACNNSGGIADESMINRDIIPDIAAHHKYVSDGNKSISTQVSNYHSTNNRQIQPSDLSRHSDHVSCEDLLEFACDGPNIHRTRGPHNGEQSDEVRIMLKVLHGHSTPESCVAALNITNWDVLAAIKLERLQDLLRKENNFVSLEDCKAMLSQCSGDVVKAATLLKSVDDSASV